MSDNLELRFLFLLLLGIRFLAWVIALVYGTKEFLKEDEVLISLEIVDFYVGEVGVDTEAEIRGESPWCRSPCKKRGCGVVNKWEGNGDWVE